jgi:hypothetical protein
MQHSIGYNSEGTTLRIVPGNGATPTTLLFSGERAYARYLLAKRVAGEAWDAKAQEHLNRLEEALDAPWALRGDDALAYLRAASLQVTVDEQALALRQNEAERARWHYSRWGKKESQWSVVPSGVPLGEREKVGQVLSSLGWRRYGGLAPELGDADAKLGNSLFAFSWDSLCEAGTKRDTLLAWDGGTSKTMSSMALADYHMAMGAERIVIVGLKKHISETWIVDQLDKLELFKERWGEDYFESWIEKKKKPSFTKPVTCISFEVLSALGDKEREWVKKMVRKAVVVMDEVYIISNVETKRTKAAFELLQGLHHIGLSGTPYRKPENAWSVLNWIFRSGSIAFPDYPVHRQGGRRRFEEMYIMWAIAEQDGSRKKVPLLKNADKFYEMCLPLVSTRRRDEPEVVRILGEANVDVQYVHLEFDEQHKAFYECILEQFAEWYLSLLEARGEPTKVLENEILVKLGFLDRAEVQPWAMQPPKDEEQDADAWEFPVFERRLTVLQQYAVDGAVRDVAAGRQVLIGSRHVAPLELVAEELEKLGLRVGLFTGATEGRTEIIRDFKAGKLDVLCASYGVAAESLNLGEATRAYVLEPDWTPSVVKQFEWRMVRGVVLESPVSYRLTIDGSIFEYKYAWGELKMASVAAGLHGEEQTATGEDILDLQQYAYSIATAHNPKLVQARTYRLQD